MSLKDSITADMKDAMRSGDKDRLGLIRMLMAAVKQREVDERITLDDAQVLSVIEKMVKQRKESVIQFQQADARTWSPTKPGKSAGCRVTCRRRSPPRKSPHSSMRPSPLPALPPSRTWAR